MMKRIVVTILSVVVFCSYSLAQDKEVGRAIRALAQEHVVVAESLEPMTTPLYSPAILTLPSGRLVASYTNAKTKSAMKNGEARYQVFLTSDDGGESWMKRAESTAMQGRLFLAGGKLYYISPGADLPIQVSEDNGETWSKIYHLHKGEAWHQTAANVWYKGDHIYLTMEKVRIKINAWNVSEKMPVLLRAKVTDDLTKASSWSFSSSFPFADIIDGVRENDPKIDYFGIPFYEQDYPNRKYMNDSKRSFSPIGWVESHVVQITDSTHFWHDPTGRTFHIFARFSGGMTNYAAMVKVVEQQDGSMEMMLQKAPSGKNLVILPFPGGHMRFHILYDNQTKLYWLLSSQSTDSMRKVEDLQQDRYALADNERQRMVLHYSSNMVDWCFAGLVAKERAINGSRHYACMDFDGEDLVILSRSGDYRAQSAHNGNLITFHRVKNFRDLVY